MTASLNRQNAVSKWNIDFGNKRFCRLYINVVANISKTGGVFM